MQRSNAFAYTLTVSSLTWSNMMPAISMVQIVFAEREIQQWSNHRWGQLLSTVCHGTDVIPAPHGVWSVASVAPRRPISPGSDECSGGREGGHFLPPVELETPAVGWQRLQPNRSASAAASGENTAADVFTRRGRIWTRGWSRRVIRMDEERGAARARGAPLTAPLHSSFAPRYVAADGAPVCQREGKWQR